MTAAGTAAAERDYDTPRQGPGDPDVDSLEALRERRDARTTGLGDLDFIDDGYLLPTADLLLSDDEDLTVPVVPMQAGEFRCARCFLVLRRRMIAGQRAGGEVCHDCV